MPTTERMEGVYTGRWLGLDGWPESAWASRIRQRLPIGCQRVWHGHRFDDKEVAALFTGATIVLDDVPKTNPDDPPVRVRLGEYVWHGSRRLGVMAANRREQTCPVPDEVCGRPLSARERARLEAGQVVHVEGLYNTFSTRRFSATLHLDDDERGKSHLVIADMQPEPAPSKLM